MEITKLYRLLLMKIKVKYFIMYILIGTGLLNAAYAQILERRPAKYDKPRLGIYNSKYKVEKDFSIKEWIVWADRSGMRSSTGDNLEFMQKFWVIDQTKDKIHIVEYDPNKYNFGLNEFQSAPKDYGWIEKEKMLLWQEALRSDERGFRVKAMTVTTPKLMVDQQEELFKSGARKLSFRNHPYTDDLNDNDSPLFEIFYVFKQEGNRYLLAKKTELSVGKAIDYVYGWVDKEAVIFWKQRQSLEPNWNSSAVSERNTERVQPAVFKDKKAAENFSSGIVTNAESLWSDPYLKREIPSWKRFPIFEKYGNIVKTGVISGVFSGTGQITRKMTSEEFSFYNETYNNQREKSRNINVVFAIDATLSMGPYIDATRRAVKEAINKLKSSANTFYFGVVGYRDHEEKGHEFERWPITKDRQTISNNLTELVEYHDKDKSKEEAVYSGLKEAVKLFEVKETSINETNIIILLGDAGVNDKSIIEQNSLINVKEAINKYKVSLLSIQAHHNKEDTYDDFIFQIKELIEETASKINQNSNNQIGAVISFKTDVSLEQKKESGSENIFRLNTEEAPIEGGIQYANRNESIESNQVSQEIVSLIEDLDQKNDELLNRLERLLNSVQVNEGDGKITPKMAQFLLDAGFDQDMILRLLDKRYQFMFEAYVPLKLNALQNPLYQYVLFLDQGELDDLMDDLGKLTKFNNSDYRKRENLSEAWIGLLSSNYGIKQEEISKMTVAEIISLVTDLPTQTNLLSEYTFEDIMDRAKMNEQQFTRMINLVKNKEDQLRQLNGSSEFYFLSNDSRFYWIPQEYLP